MVYRKFQGDLLFNGYGMMPPGNVLITDESGIVQEICRLEDAGDGIEKHEGLISPGFVNTHCHLELSHMKGRIPPGTGMVPFLTRVIRERNYPEALISEAMQQAAAEMYSGGIVAVGDVCNTTGSIPVKNSSPICWHNFIEVIGFTADKAAERLAYAANVLNGFAEPSATAEGYSNREPAHQASLSPHAPYSVSAPLFRLINEASAGKTITIHNQEAAAENELYRFGTGPMFDLYANLGIDASFFAASGSNSLPTYLPWLNRVSAIILVHNTCTTGEDVDLALAIAGNIRLYFSICINANRYITSLNPPLDMLRKKNCTLTIGTDSYASNHQLNMLEEMKTLQQQCAVPLAEMLQWATLNGAKALNLDHRLGSFEPGRQPGVVLISGVTGGRLEDAAVAKRIL